MPCRLALSSAVPPSALAQATFRRLVHAPCHMMLAPMVSVLAHLLALLVSRLGRHLLPCLVLLLLGLVSSVLLVLCLPIATLFLSFTLAFALDNIAELVIKLEMSLESIERSQHGHNLLITGGLAPQVPLVFR